MFRRTGGPSAATAKPDFKDSGLTRFDAQCPVNLSGEKFDELQSERARVLPIDAAG